jgi:trk system potassium uptake protein TrkA
MQVIILGASRAGLTLLRRLIRSEHDVVLVDPNAEEIVAKNNIDVVTINGVIIDMESLREAGIESADAVCALSESENQNLMASQIARDIFKVKHVITRIFDTEGHHMFDDSGFVTLSSTELTVDAFLHELADTENECTVDQCSATILGENIQFDVVNADDSLVGSKIREVEDTDGRHVFGIIRHDRMILALPSLRIEKGDKLILAESRD